MIDDHIPSLRMKRSGMWPSAKPPSYSPKLVDIKSTTTKQGLQIPTSGVVKDKIESANILFSRRYYPSPLQGPSIVSVLPVRLFFGSEKFIEDDGGATQSRAPTFLLGDAFSNCRVKIFL